MSTEHVLPKWLPEAAAEPQEPPEDLGSVASTFLGVLFTSPDWLVVQQELEQLARDNSIEGILRRQQEALFGIANSSRRGVRHRGPLPRRRPSPDLDRLPPDAIQKARKEAQRSLAKELEAAEEEFRAVLPRLLSSSRR